MDSIILFLEGRKMNNKNNKNLTLVAGLALFSMFFGAGNLIFPPYLGFITSNHWIVSTIGFLITGVGIVMLGVIATTKSGGSINTLSDKVSPIFSKIFGTAIILCIGPGFAIPRTAATSYEIIKNSLYPNFSAVICSVLFFFVVFLFVVKPSDIIDRIGKYLTPALLLVLFVIIIKGVFTPIGQTTGNSVENTFSLSFQEGYQTMDALAALIFTTIVISTFMSKGVTETKELNKLTIKAALIAGIGLCIVYGGLLYVGATASTLDFANLSRTEILTKITYLLLGNTGNIVLSLAILLACLTTAIGLLSSSSQYFYDLCNEKINYMFFVIIFTIFSAYFAIRGVDSIVIISGPVLTALYPISILLIVTEFFKDKIKYRGFYFGAILGAFYPTILNILSIFNINIDSAKLLFLNISQSFEAFIWIIPALVLGILFTIIEKIIKRA